MPGEKLEEIIEEENEEGKEKEGTGKRATAKGRWFKVLMTCIIPFRFLYTCIIPHTITRCEHIIVNVKRSGERWLAPTDETAM